MRLPGRRSGLPIRKPSTVAPESGAIQQLLVVIVLLATIVLVLFALPQTGDYSERTLVIAKKSIQQDKAIKGVVVSHGFLKIAVNVASVSEPPEPQPPPEPQENVVVVSTNAPTTPSTQLATNPQSNRLEKEPTAVPETKSLPEEENDTVPTGKPKTRIKKEDSPVLPPPPPRTKPPTIQMPLVYQQSKDEILIDVIFHRIKAPEADSLLSCRLSEDDIASALEAAQQTWRRQARIVLRYSNRATAWEHVSMDAQKSFEEHLARFPKNDESGQPWTTENPGRIGLVANELIQILSSDNVDRWTTQNPINIFCIGAFVGYNGVTWSRHVFIRSMQYHKTDKPMDKHMFSRILAHEVGHVLSLPHPGYELCSQSCEATLCNLMCQQRSLPQGTDPRFARSLNSLQVSRSRTSAALLDNFNTAHFMEGAQVAGISTQTVSNARASKASMLFIQKPLNMNSTVKVSKLMFLLTKIKPTGSVALVVGKPSPTGDSMHVKVKALGTMGNTMTVSREGVSKLVFEDLDSSWWTNARHLEVTVNPLITVEPGCFLGIAFSTPGISLQVVRRPGLELVQVQKVPLSFFSPVKASPITEFRLEHVSGFGPIFSAIIEQ